MAERDPEAIRRFVERFAAELVDAGVPRMPARVFAALQSADSGRMTSAELAELLRVSPAAISGAVRYLSHVHMVRRERAVGSRRDQYVVDGDVWYQAILDRDHVLLAWERSLREGVETLGADTPAGRRLNESVAFFAYMRRKLPLLLEGWQKTKAELRGGWKG